LEGGKLQKKKERLKGGSRDTGAPGRCSREEKRQNKKKVEISFAYFFLVFEGIS